MTDRIGEIYNPGKQGYERWLSITEAGIPKPRMTQRDRWAKRPIVKRWNAYKDMMRLHGSSQKFNMPFNDYWLIFTFSTPLGMRMDGLIKQPGMPHMQRPDKDNLEKGFIDIFLPHEDSMVFDGRVTKLWGDRDLIELWWKDATGSR